MFSGRMQYAPTSGHTVRTTVDSLPLLHKLNDRILYDGIKVIDQMPIRLLSIFPYASPQNLFPFFEAKDRIEKKRVFASLSSATTVCEKRADTPPVQGSRGPRSLAGRGAAPHKTNQKEKRDFKKRVLRGVRGVW